MDPRVERYAIVLVDYSTRIKEGERVIIRGNIQAEPLLLACAQRCMEKGAEVTIVPKFNYMDEFYMRYASDEIIKRVSLYDRFIYENYDASIRVWADDNNRALTNVPLERLQWAEEALKPNSKIVLKRAEPWMGVKAWNPPPAGCFRYVGCQWPTGAGAMDADMGYYEYFDFIMNAVGADNANPYNFWINVARNQEKYIERLNKTTYIHMAGPYIDMQFNVRNRPWINCDGRFNMPDGEVFTSPVENSVNGWAKFTYPSIKNSTLVEDIEVEMEDGKCISAKAKTEAQTKFLNALLDTDPYCRTLGELAIGTNPYITKGTKNILFDEKISSTIHMAFGVGYPESGSMNEDAAIHWDMICDMKEGEIRADGELIYQNGKFLF